MKFIEYVYDRLKKLDVDCSVSNNEIHVSNQETSYITKIRMEEDWEEAYRQLRQARSINFNCENRVLIHNNSVSYFLVRLTPTFSLSQEQYEFQDQKGNTISINTASMIFSLAFFESSEYDNFFKIRIAKRLTKVRNRRISTIMWQPTTSTYTAKGRKTPANLQETALQKTKDCLFKLAVEQHDCLAVWKPKVKRLKSIYLDEPLSDFSIPRVAYEDNVVSFYKVAQASPFPSRSFLAYYHVLEYYFLKVSEDLLHHRLTAMLNDPRFRPNRDNLDKAIALVRGQDARNDETEMLRNVLERFVSEGDLIQFINRFEKECNDRIYTKKRAVFGEHIEIAAKEGHVISNAAKALKHVRNAIVHSSDRYKREDCHIPMSESEIIIEEFIPLVRFFAEQVIYGTAT